MHEFTEIQKFLIFLIEGAIISFVFDFFRSIRKNFASNDIVTFIEDLIFLSFVSVIIMVSVIYFCNGVIRFYIFLGIFLGICIYALTLSKRCVIIFSTIIKMLGKLFKL